MAWDDADTDAAGHVQAIEIVGTSLRLTGTIHLGRFGRLTDFVNASRGFIRIHDARLLLPNGTATDLAWSELMVDQDEISFIAQQDPTAPETGVAVGFLEPKFEAEAVRKPREFVLITPGHSITGKIHVFGQTDVAAFVDASDPHFIAMTDARMRSLDDTISSTYDFVLVNRDQMVAASEVHDRDESRSDFWAAAEPAAEQ